MGKWQPPEYYDTLECFPPEVYRPPWKIRGQKSPPGGDWLTRFGQISFRVRPNDTILDLGCGAGLLAAYLHHTHSHSGRYIGLDNSPRRIEFAYKGNEGGHPRAEFHSVDLESEDLDQFTDDGVDLIVCAETLEHLKDDVAFVKKWPVGVFCVITIPTFDCPSHIRVFTEQTAASRYKEQFSGLRCLLTPMATRVGASYRRSHSGYRGWILLSGVRCDTVDSALPPHDTL